MNNDTGKIYFIGAGPGDFELLTIKGKSYLEKADCVIYDRLINERILDFVNPSAELIYLGKDNTEGGILQNKINQTLVEKSLSKKYKTIIRLKGGDPFVFGRGGEEIQELLLHNIDFEVVPGISSSISVPSYAGIPVTHRGISKSFHVFTGMTANNKEDIQDFKNISKLEGTLIFLMGVKNLAIIVNNLISFGKNPNTPIAIIENGCTSQEIVTTGILSTIIEKSKNISPPAIIIIGDVVNKREDFKWFEKKPLFGKSIILTREKNEAQSFARTIESLGGKAILLPTIEFIDKMNSFDYSTLAKYHGLMFNSPIGVNFFFKNIPDMRCLGNIKIGAVGEKTKEELKKYKIIPDIVPTKYLTDNLAFEMTKITKEEDKILIITSNKSLIDDNLFQKKYQRFFKKIVGYENNSLFIEKNLVLDTLKKSKYLTFFSSSAVESFFSNLSDINLLPIDTHIISIGPSTTATIKKYTNNHVTECINYTGEDILKVLEKI